MIFAVDFDGTIVSQEHAYDDVATPLQFLPGAREALYALKAAGHVLILWSGRAANRALLKDPTLDTLVRAGLRTVDPVRWLRQREVAQARLDQMLAFVEAELPDVFAAVSDGAEGKPSADLFIDDKALRLGDGHGAVGWDWIAELYGEPVDAQAEAV